MDGGLKLLPFPYWSLINPGTPVQVQVYPEVNKIIIKVHHVLLLK